jgi:putative DNA primase/helicase
LEDDSTVPANDVIVTADAILHPATAVAGGGTLPPTPKLFAVNSVPYRYNPTAACPHWLAFLNSLWSRSPDQIATLQEVAGYLLTPDTSQQKMFMFIGPKRSGKGTIARVFGGMVGTHNVCAPTLGSLQGDFGMQPLLGKTVAIIGDARLSGRTDEGQIVERLLSITGEDQQTVNRKNIAQVTTQLRTRFLLLSNELPRLRDASATLASRLIFLRFTESFYGREDHGLTARLIAELPGILNWSLVGWKRLNDRGYFLQPATGRELHQQMEEIASPVLAFVRDRCTVQADAQIGKGTLFKSWKDWCETKGHKAGTDSVFARNLMAAVPSVSSSRPRIDGERVTAFDGIQLVQDWP